MSKNIVFEGWLTKSPPTNRIWKTKWRRRWFALRQSGELPGQYFLDYYADRNCRRLKGTINLDFCEQVDAGLHMERSTNGALDPKLRGSVFTIQTQSRIYHLEADCEAEMEKWVDAICSVCGLRATDEARNNLDTYENNICNTNTSVKIITEPVVASNRTNTNCNQNNSPTGNHIKTDNAVVTNDNQTEISNQYEGPESTGPYIPISECITGVRAQDTQRAFTFDPKNIVISTKPPTEAVPENKNQMHITQPQIRVTNVELSENESNLSDEECKSLNASQCNIGNWSVAKTFTKMSINSPVGDGVNEPGPPVPPRPPKTFVMSKDLTHKESFHGPKLQEPPDMPDTSPFPWVRVPRRMSYGTVPTSPGRSVLVHSTVRTTDDEEEYPVSHSLQYYNLSTLPPAVDRALKPRHSSHSVGHVNIVRPHVSHINVGEVSKPDVLQYLDLDLHTTKPPSSKALDTSKKPIVHGKSLSSTEDESAYKTVDFLKTEAFNITRQDAEASRSNQQ